MHRACLGPAQVVPTRGAALHPAQVLRYGYLQTYREHMDTLGDEASGPRVATVLLYLSGAAGGAARPRSPGQGARRGRRRCVVILQ